MLNRTLNELLWKSVLHLDQSIEINCKSWKKVARVNSHIQKLSSRFPEFRLVIKAFRLHQWVRNTKILKFTMMKEESQILNGKMFLFFYFGKKTWKGIFAIQCYCKLFYNWLSRSDIFGEIKYSRVFLAFVSFSFFPTWLLDETEGKKGECNLFTLHVDSKKKFWRREKTSTTKKHLGSLMETEGLQTFLINYCLKF